MEVDSEYVVGAAIRQLRQKYKTAHLYREDQSQNLTRPCFIVDQLQQGFERQMYGRVKRGYRLKITYLAEENTSELKRHLRAVGEELLEHFQILTLSEKSSVFGRNAEYEVVDGELIFTIELPMHLIPKEASQPQMHNLATHSGFKP